MTEVVSSKPTLEPGDLAPDCTLPTTDGKVVSLRSDSIAGNPLVLIFCPHLSETARRTLDRFSNESESLSNLGARTFVILRRLDQTLTTTFPLLLDPNSQLISRFSERADKACVVILRRNYHVAAVLTCDSEDAVSATTAVLQSMAWERKTISLRIHPPALIIPEVLSRQDCTQLIDIFETKGQDFFDPQPIQDFLNGSDFKMRIPEYGRQDRVDHFFFDPTNLAFLNKRLNRVWPEIYKSFHYAVQKYETLRIARYEGQRGGFTHGHRDNNPPTAYRRFAMSINLNTPDYEGGELRFPEFGDQRYRPDTGSAIVFSSTLLHEAMHVTAGRRYVLLAFLFGDT